MRPAPTALLLTPSPIVVSSQPETQLGDAHAEWDSGLGCSGESELRMLAGRSRQLLLNLGLSKPSFCLA